MAMVVLLIGILPIDPWGQTIIYSNAATATQLTATTNVATVAFRLWSSGPNRASELGGGDDRVLPTGLDVTFAQVRARIPATACP